MNFLVAWSCGCGWKSARPYQRFIGTDGGLTIGPSACEDCGLFLTTRIELEPEAASEWPIESFKVAGQELLGSESDPLTTALRELGDEHDRVLAGKPAAAEAETAPSGHNTRSQTLSCTRCGCRFCLDKSEDHPGQHVYCPACGDDGPRHPAPLVDDDGDQEAGSSLQELASKPRKCAACSVVLSSALNKHRICFRCRSAAAEHRPGIDACDYEAAGEWWPCHLDPEHTGPHEHRPYRASLCEFEFQTGACCLRERDHRGPHEEISDRARALDRRGRETGEQ